MRLINADALMLHLSNYALQESPNDNESIGERRISEMVYRVIQNCIEAVEKQPTAYNPEKVVEIVRVDCYTMGFDESQTEIIVEDIRKGGIKE